MTCDGSCRYLELKVKGGGQNPGKKAKIMQSAQHCVTCSAYFANLNDGTQNCPCCGGPTETHEKHLKGKRKHVNKTQGRGKKW